MTTLIRSRLPLSSWKVAACCATSVGSANPGRSATRNSSRSVSAASEEQTIHGSGQPAPTGVSTPVKPDCSAARATSPR
nr:hypothetical protein [Blastococcus sp. TML/C7B]